MTAAPKTIPLMTAEQFYQWTSRPEHDYRWFELDRGRVIELPPPGRPHGFVVLNIGVLLNLFCRKRGFGYVVTDSGVILQRDPDTVRGPDVALYEDAKTFAELNSKYGDAAPILAVEVLSPSDRPGAVQAKLADYLNGGVKIVWHVDCEDRRVIVYRPNRNPLVVPENGELLGGDELPGFQCSVKELFVLPGEHPTSTQPATE